MRWNLGMSPSCPHGHESRRRRDREIYFDLIVSIPKVHHIIRLALAIIMNISDQHISIYVKHVRFHGVSRCHRRRRSIAGIARALVSRRYTCTVATRTRTRANSSPHHSERDETERYHLNFNESCGCKCRSYSFRLHSCATSISTDATVHVYTRVHTRTHTHKRDTRGTRVTMSEHAPSSLVYIRPCKILSSFAPHSSSLHLVYPCKEREGERKREETNVGESSSLLSLPLFLPLSEHIHARVFVGERHKSVPQLYQDPQKEIISNRFYGETAFPLCTHQVSKPRRRSRAFPFSLPPPPTPRHSSIPTLPPVVAVSN